MIKENIDKVNHLIESEKKIIREINSLISYAENTDDNEKKMIESQVELLTGFWRKINNHILDLLNNLEVKAPEKAVKSIEKKIKEEKPIQKPKIKSINRTKILGEKITELDKKVIKRLKQGERKQIEKKEEKPSTYVKIANRLFARKVRLMFKQKKFATLEKDLIKSNLGITSITYLSVIGLTTILALIVATFIFTFFLLFDMQEGYVITRATENIFLRIAKTFWILIIVPSATALLIYFYPSLEKKSLSDKIDQELPFATIHMAAISGSRIEPTKIFRVVSLTKEYPNLEREFNKLLNEINIYGYDLVTALKDSAINSPSQKLADLFNGLATTITSGGDLYDFFQKRSQTLLFEYRLDREKQTKSAETFMDIYISVVIAAPMILMLLLMMMKISGLGISLTTSALTLLVVGGVSVINIFFLVFLQLKQSPGGGA
jgi:hypothetical protein